MLFMSNHSLTKKSFLFNNSTVSLLNMSPQNFTESFYVDFKRKKNISAFTVFVLNFENLNPLIHKRNNKLPNS